MIEGRLPKHLWIRGSGTQRRRGATLACFVVLACVMALSTPGWDGPQGKVMSFPDHWQETVITAGYVDYNVRAINIDPRLGYHIGALAQGNVHGTPRHLDVLYCLESSPPCAYVYTPAAIKDIEREERFVPAWPSGPPSNGGGPADRYRGSDSRMQSAEYAEGLTGANEVAVKIGITGLGEK